MINAIIACDGRGGISKNGVMPWPRNKKDLRHFKEVTSGKTVVMGRKTWEAKDMPSPLPGRKNIVVTSDPNYNAPGASVISENVKETIIELGKHEDVFVIGGASLFEFLLDTITILHLTRISGNYDCDTFIEKDLINDNFYCIDTVSIDEATKFETHIARHLHDLYFYSKIR